MIEFVVEGVPVSKLRPRVTRTHTYTPKKTRDYEKLVQWSYKNKYKDEPLEGALSIEIDFYMYMPKNTSKVRTKAKESGEILPVKKPDIDNLAKAITDALNGIAYKDDNQIVEMHLYKYYSINPRAEIKIKKIK